MIDKYLKGEEEEACIAKIQLHTNSISNPTP